MLYVLWAFLNVVLVVLFFVLCYHTIKLIRNQYGFFSALVLFCVGCSFLSGSNKKQNTASHTLSFHNQATFGFDENAANWHIADSAAREYDLKERLNAIAFETPLFKVHLDVSLGQEIKTGI